MLLSSGCVTGRAGIRTELRYSSTVRVCTLGGGWSFDYFSVHIFSCFDIWLLVADVGGCCHKPKASVQYVKYN